MITPQTTVRNPILNSTLMLSARVSALRPLLLTAGLLSVLCGASLPTSARAQSNHLIWMGERTAGRAPQTDRSVEANPDDDDGQSDDDALLRGGRGIDSSARGLGRDNDALSATGCSSTNVNGTYEVVEFATYKCSIYASNGAFLQTNYISFDYTWRGTDACGNEMLRGYYSQTSVSPTTGGFTFAKPVNYSSYTLWEYTDNTAAWQCKATYVGPWNGKTYMDGYSCTDGKVRICDQL